MDVIKEKKIENYPEAFSLKLTEIIVEQMKNKICQILLEDGTKGTGFFCKIPFPDNNNKLSVLITNNHVINKFGNEISIIYKDGKLKKIELNDRKKYTNEEYDITIIEIKEKDNIKEYLEIDENIMNEGYNIIYIKQSIYLLQYLNEEKLVSYGIIKSSDLTKEYNFLHLCYTENGSSGGPILNKENKVIGIHKEGHKLNNYNKGLFINQPIKEFFCLNEINKENNLKLEEKLDLSNKNIKNIYIEILENNQLQELYLNNNQISDIKLLEKVKFENLEELDLNNNKISDIEILEKVKFYNLKTLNLSNNQISDIEIFDKVKFKNLEQLGLENNKISKIEVLEKVNFENLQGLYLNNNQISDINVLEKVKFENLEELGLRNNQISDINVLENVKFKNLQGLSISNNQISDIEVLEKVKFENLEKLYLNNNQISDIKVFEKVKFKNLQVLRLNHNQINKNKFSSLIKVLKNTIENFKC